MLADAVFEGGGVKGIGLVGALSVAERQGYEWRRVAGSSAGSMIAALVAAGYKSEEISKLIMKTNINSFLTSTITNRIPYIGPALKIWFKNGLFSSAEIESWMEEILAAKGIHTFADFSEDSLQIIVSDITSGDLVIFPRDLPKYGIRPDEMSVASAVRMSCSIPFFFQPVPFYSKKDDRVVYMVDGGLLSNFPVWIFDRDKPRWPTFGFRLKSDKSQFHDINGPFSMLSSIVLTMLEAHDNYSVRDHDDLRTIQVPTLGVSLIDFDLSKEKQQELFKSGVSAGEDFFAKFTFSNYLEVRRKK